MIISNTVRLAIAAACLATIATAPQAPAQTAARTVVVKHPPVVNQGDLSESWSARQNVIESKQYEAVAGEKSCFPPSADAKGMRPDHRSGTPSKLPQELQSGLNRRCA